MGAICSNDLAIDNIQNPGRKRKHNMPNTKLKDIVAFLAKRQRNSRYMKLSHYVSTRHSRGEKKHKRRKRKYKIHPTTK